METLRSLRAWKALRNFLITGKTLQQCLLMNFDTRQGEHKKMFDSNKV